MVVQRTLAKIEELKDRPHHERRAIAVNGAVVVVAMLGVVWGFFAVHAVGRTAINLARNLDGSNTAAQQAASAPPARASIESSQSAAAASSIQAVSSQEMLTASSTNGYVDLVPAQ